MPEARRRTTRSSKTTTNPDVKITKRSEFSPEVGTDSSHGQSSNNENNSNDQVTYFNEDTKQLLNIQDPMDNRNANEMTNEHVNKEYEEFESGTEGEEYDEEEYDELDLTEDRLYEVLSPFLETQDGEGVADVLLGIRESLDEHTEAVRELTQTLRDYFNRRVTTVVRPSKPTNR